MLQRNATVIATFGLCILALVLLLSLTACGSVPVAATPTPNLSVGEALRRDAQQYAEDMGVSLDQAVRRLQYQEGIGELNAALSANEVIATGRIGW